MKVEQFFNNLWEQYTELTPQAKQIQTLFCEQGNEIFNDHVAFRTFNIHPISLDELEILILRMGYKYQEEYYFSDKKLRAKSFLPPAPEHPKIFISELLTEKFPESSQQIIKNLVKQIDPSVLSTEKIFFQGRLWEAPRFDDYEELLKVSEYAAWMSVMGMCANHFTIDVNRLQSLKNIQDVTEFLSTNGFKLNDSNGVIKGNPSVKLEQCSTIADTTSYRFANGMYRDVPTCFYEFAYRYPEDDGELFQGFVQANANTIFESTHVK